MYKYSLKNLLKRKTISQGHTDDLKIETKTKRVWLSRLTIADGMPYNNQVTEEQYQAPQYEWKTIGTYEAI